MKFIEHYQKELALFKEEGKKLSENFPAVASLLGEGAQDPDVERLLEGTAFLTAGIKQRLESQSLELVQGMVQAVCPQLLKPVPSMTTLKLTPKNNLKEGLNVPAGTYVDSQENNGLKCRFRTCSDVQVSPLSLLEVKTVEKKIEGLQEILEITLSFQLSGQTLESWDADSLSLFLSAGYEEASTQYYLLSQFLRDIRLTESQSGRTLNLPILPIKQPDVKKRVLLPDDFAGFSGVSVLQEYLYFPEKFLYLDLDLTFWKERSTGNRFELTFVCDLPAFSIPAFTKESFDLFCVPALNLFAAKAAPFIQKHHSDTYPLKVEGFAENQARVYSVNRVQGQLGMGGKREFENFYRSNPEKVSSPVYQVHAQASVDEQEWVSYIKFAYPAGMNLNDQEIISADLSCTNAEWAEQLNVGEINQPSYNTPELVQFENLSKPTAYLDSLLDEALLKKLLNHLSMNYSSLSDVETLKETLKAFVFPEQRNKIREKTNLKKIDGIRKVQSDYEERFFKRSLLRGQNIHIEVQQDFFVSKGDVYLFGEVLDHFFSTVVSINAYSQLTFEDVTQWEKIQWPARLGDRKLL